MIPNCQQPEKKEFILHWHEIYHKYSELRVLLPEHIDHDLKDFFSKIFNNVQKYNPLNQRLTSDASDEEYEKIVEAQKDVFQFLEQKIPSLQESLISEMRKTLGVHIEK